MNMIALAILVVGLCFYNAFLVVHGKEIDNTAGLIAFIGAVIILLKA